MKVWNELQWHSIGIVVSTWEKGYELCDWDVRRPCLVVIYRCFGKTYRSNLQGSTYEALHHSKAKPLTRPRREPEI